MWFAFFLLFALNAFAAGEASLCPPEGDCLKITGDLRVVPAGKASGKGAGKEVATATRLNEKGLVEMRAPGSRSWSTSVLRAPPPGFSYDQAVVDGEGHLFVRLGGDAKGFNFVGPGGSPVVIASQVSWEGQEPPQLTSYVSDLQQNGFFALGEDGSVYRVMPPAYFKGPFRSEVVFSGKARGIALAGTSLIVQKEDGSLMGSADVAGGRWKEIPLPEGDLRLEGPAVFGAKAANAGPKKAMRPVELKELPARKNPVAKVDAGKLEKAVSDRILRVEEFAGLKKEADRLGVRAYLFGGAAFSATHHVKRDILGSGGDYAFSSIYKPSQDIDIVVDGTPEQAKALQAFMAENYPRERGGASLWEARPLREKAGDKDGLLTDADFHQQHTDSASTGLIELTDPPRGKSRVRDLKAWEGGHNKFLSDAAEGKLSLYFSPGHATTRRFLEGKNPPMIEAVRFLTKAFQEDLEIDPADWKRIGEIVSAFDPNAEGQGYVQRWMELSARKLFENARDPADAWAKLEASGMLTRLEDLASGEGREGSLAWWLRQKPASAANTAVEAATEAGKAGEAVKPASGNCRSLFSRLWR